MGGQGSGGHNRLSDEEKKRRGTFRADQSDDVYDARQASNVITGVFLSQVPPPELPLGPEGKAKYEEIAKLLFDGNKLTRVSCMQCEQLAVLWQRQHDLLSAKKMVPVSLVTKIASLLATLRVAENAPAIASPGQRNRFEGSGFSNSRTSPIRLRPRAS